MLQCDKVVLERFELSNDKNLAEIHSIGGDSLRFGTVGVIMIKLKNKFYKKSTLVCFLSILYLCRIGSVEE